jgi:hypothetical protein
MIRNRLAQASDDRGVALVAAMGVALIGMMVASLVIAQTIMASNDSGRDRLRTTEIHTAEGAIDATMARLETESPCTINPQDIGGGVQETRVTVELFYFDDLSATPIGCTGGTLDAVPTKATVRATSVGTRDSVGLNPERTLEANLALVPRPEQSEDAAIFSGTDISVGAGFTLSPKVLDSGADVWVDDGDWDCSGGAKLDGSLIVPQGSVKFPNSQCHVGGDVWAQNGFRNNSTGAGTYSVDGNLTVRSGNLTTDNPLYVGGDILVGGSKVGYHPANAEGTAKYNVGPGAITDIAPVGLPIINYTPSDWAGFQKLNKVDMSNLINAQYPMQSWERSEIDKCNYAGWISSIKGPVKLPATDTVFDMRSCPSGFRTQSGFAFELFADTAIFPNSFTTSNPLTFSSGDGNPHKLWVIVPHATGNGFISNSTPMTIKAPLESFWYAPGRVDINNSSSFIGQVYGGDVTIHTPATFTFTNVGVPNITLGSSATTSSGSYVELLYKREVS